MCLKVIFFSTDLLLAQRNAIDFLQANLVSGNMAYKF